MLLASITVNAQDLDMTDGKVMFHTPVKSQGRDCCCWDFAATSLLESELYRQHGKVYDLSEMWIARHAYYDKAIKYVRNYGKSHYRCGGICADAYAMIKKYGIVPQEAYEGLRGQDGKYNHRALVEELRTYLAALVQMKNGTMTPNWEKDIDEILDRHIGVRPEKFIYNGKEYTPKSFADALNINLNDYVTVTSFSCYPMDSWIMMEIPDNWRWDRQFNTDFETYKSIMDYALSKGYTVGIAADFSDPTVKGPTREILNVPAELGEITLEVRTKAYLNHYNTDDHAVHAIGISYDSNGKMYYKIKDSSGKNSVPGEGHYCYMSADYLHFKTTNLFVHKKGLPQALRRRL